MKKKRKQQGKPFLLHAFFPTHCPFCGEAILRTEECCADCMEQLPALRLKQMALKPLPGIAGVQGIYRYADGVRYAIAAMKFQSDRETGLLLGDALGRMVKTRYRQEKIDVMIPVPLSKRRRFTRGYNQAEWLAERVMAHTGIPVQTEVLKKIRHTYEQHQQTAKERSANLAGVFQVADSAAVAGKTILLVDDVYTTGWTASFCAQVLREAGAERVFVAVVAVTEKPNGKRSQTSPDNSIVG